MVLACEGCKGYENSVFKCLTLEERKQLTIGFKQKHIPKGTIIFEEGTYPEGLVCLAKGKAKVFKCGINGKAQILRMAKPVGFIGYRALFAEEEHTSTAIAIEDSTICIFERDSLYHVMRTNPSLSMNIIKSFATELEFSMNRTVTLTQKHIRGRLAESLIFLHDTYGVENKSLFLNAKLTREDLANLSSMTTSNAIRTLQSFAHEGIIEIEGRQIRIINHPELERICKIG